MAAVDLTRVPENVRKQLALAVRSIQWSYAIFWSISAKGTEALEWGDGYYNGDIKTRKTVQAVELEADQLGLQRTEQLRELFESLSPFDMSPQTKRPTVALCPEDLTSAEWYFLVCMSFRFQIGQGLPGNSLAMNQTVWLCNANRVDTKSFSRSILARSALIQTVVCFPHFGGVIELGTTELVPENPDLISHLRTSFLECPSGNISNTPIHGSDSMENHAGFVCEILQHEYDNIPDSNLDQLLDCGGDDTCSPNNSSDDFANNVLREDSSLVDVVDQDASEIQNWLEDDAVDGNDIGNHVNCSDSGHANDACGQSRVEEHNEPKNNFSVFHGDADVRYQSVLSTLLKSSHQLVLGPYFRNGITESNFVSWKDNVLGARFPKTVTPQRVLKKVIIEVARMHEKLRLRSDSQNGKSDNLSRRQVDEVDRNHVLSERKRREKINERLMILGSLVPSGGKVDKVSILDHTIEYLKELERKVEVLESGKEAMELESTTRTKPQDSMERTSDNYGPNKVDGTKKPMANKRKVCETKRAAVDSKRSRLRDASNESLTVSISDKDVLIDIKCCWRECLVLELMESVAKLNLDTQTVQSSNKDGILSMSITAKRKGAKGAAAGAIKQALQKVIIKR